MSATCENLEKYTEQIFMKFHQSLKLNVSSVVSSSGQRENSIPSHKHTLRDNIYNDEAKPKMELFFSQYYMKLSFIKFGGFSVG